jgi:putative ATP-dependent endonuclease of the OLD family
MYLHELKLWNFRKFGGKGDVFADKKGIRPPDLNVPFQDGLNVLIGENDSGKTAIIDAIKFVLKTHSTEWIRVSFEDFYENTRRMRIECIFKNLLDEEAKHFIEWLGMEGEGELAKPYLRLILDIQHNGDQILPFEVRAGADDVGYILTAEAREYLKATYLKPLRDAQQELIPKRNSRLSQILEGHEVFKGDQEKHELKMISQCFNCLTQKYFDREHADCNENCIFKDKFFNQESKSGGEDKIRTDINNYIQKFLGDIDSSAKFGVISPKLKNILEGLKLAFDEEFDPGLGSQNLLFIAAELLNLDRSNWTGLRLGLIEELEAHLHPQAQLRVIEYLQEFISDKREKGKDIQLILTTHSPNLGSKVELKNLLICFDNEVFPVGEKHTELEADDYKFLQRFLDVTKANLFFAKGVILVEGWAEELLLPALAKKIGIDLTQKGISIINVGGTAFLRYGKIFRRKDGKKMNVPVAIVTDLDIKPAEELTQENGKAKKDAVKESKEQKYNGQSVKCFVSPQWTLEYCLLKSSSLCAIFQEIVKSIHSSTDFADFEQKLTEKIENKSLNKTEIAYRLGAKIEESFSTNKQPDQDEINGATIEIKVDDKSIEYLMNAIKYAAGEDVGNNR